MRIPPGNAGEVLFQTLTAASALAGGNTVNGVPTIQSVAIDAVIGVYTATCVSTRTNRGIFDLKAPDGGIAGRINVGTPLTSGFLNLTIADGSADFAVGDAFNITVSGSARYAAYNFAADPTPPQVATAMLRADVDASGGSVEQFATANGPAIIAAAHISLPDGTPGDGVSGLFGQAIVQLGRSGIVLRNSHIDILNVPADS